MIKYLDFEHLRTIIIILKTLITIIVQYIEPNKLIKQYM